MNRKRLILGLSTIAIGLSSFMALAQAPVPPPGNPAGFPPQGPGPVILNPNQQSPNPNTPPPGFQNPNTPPPGFQNPNTPPPPPGWGAPGFLANPPQGEWMNSGTLNVMATGYDSQGVMTQIPLFISYNYNGVNYNVMVLNAWNPYTQMWNSGIDVPANQTSYFLNGFSYNYYAVLPSGTFYFNL